VGSNPTPSAIAMGPIGPQASVPAGESSGAAYG